jgi:hypothetical protein
MIKNYVQRDMKEPKLSEMSNWYTIERNVTAVDLPDDGLCKENYRMFNINFSH